MHYRTHPWRTDLWRTRLAPVIALALAIAAALPVSAQATKATRGYGRDLALAPGQPAPDLRGWGFDQQLQSIPYDGYVTLVNFWATWCEPCRQEMPALQRLQDKFGEQGLQVVGFNQESDATLDQVIEHLESLGVSYANLKPDYRWNWGAVLTVPTSFLVGPDGAILRKYVGAQPEQVAGLERDVEDAVNGRQLKAMVLPKPATPED